MASQSLPNVHLRVPAYILSQVPQASIARFGSLSRALVVALAILSLTKRARTVSSNVGMGLTMHLRMLRSPQRRQRRRSPASSRMSLVVVVLPPIAASYLRCLRCRDDRAALTSCISWLRSELRRDSGELCTRIQEAGILRRLEQGLDAQ
jgi:hypothetical protein